MNLNTLYQLSYGLYVVSSKKGEKLNGQIANAVFQVTAEPPQIAVSINKQNLTHEFIRESGVFTISILAQDTPLEFIGHFGFHSGRDLDKFQGVNYKIGVTGAPVVLENTIGYIEAEVFDLMEVGTHTVFIGKIVEAQIIKAEEPLTYAYYHRIKRGVTPRRAATYIKQEEGKPGTEARAKYRCTVCGYIYDPEVGDPDGGISPGTSFEELPEDRVCPVCGAGKEAFEKED